MVNKSAEVIISDKISIAIHLSTVNDKATIKGTKQYHWG